MTGYGWVRRGLLALMLIGATTADAEAQWRPTFIFVGETAGDDVSLVLGQVSLHPDRLGLNPVVSLQSYYLDYPGGSTWAIAPSGGLRHQAETGAFQALVGYHFAADDAVPIQGGDEDGVVTSLQGDYWGTGAVNVQGIASYNWGSEYLWTRARAATRIANMATGSLMLGVEGVWQGELGDEALLDPNYSATQIGPILQWNTGRGFSAIAGGGWKNVDEDFFADGSTWYAKIEFVLR